MPLNNLLVSCLKIEMAIFGQNPGVHVARKQYYYIFGKVKKEVGQML